MGRALTYGIELAVGLGCLAASVPAWRIPRLRWLAAVLAIAGAVAAGHALVELLGG